MSFAEPGHGSRFSPKLVVSLIVCLCVAAVVVVLYMNPPVEEETEGTNSPPVASFTYSPSSPTTDNVIQFTDNSTDEDGMVVEWSWDFGDGETSSNQNPTHQYENAGTYTVTLTVRDNGGKSDTFSVSIEVSGEAVFQDFEPGNGTQEAYFYDAWRSTSSFETDVVHKGTRAVKMVVPPEINNANGATIGITAASQVGYIDLSDATSLSVWVYDTQGSNTIELKLKDLFGNIGSGLWSTENSVWNTWTKITWDISGYSGVDMSRIASVELYEWNEGTYYFDDVTFK